MSEEARELFADLEAVMMPKALETFLTKWGGHRIPKPRTLNLEARDAEIRSEWGPPEVTYAKLARRYGLSPRQIRRIVHRRTHKKAA